MKVIDMLLESSGKALQYKAVIMQNLAKSDLLYCNN